MHWQLGPLPGVRGGCQSRFEARWPSSEGREVEGRVGLPGGWGLSTEDGSILDAKQISHALAPLRFARFQFVMEALEPLRLPPYKGSTLRGAFGVAFKEAACVSEEKVCARCLIAMNCPYHYVFDTPIPPGSLRMRKYTAAPHPFVLEPPLEARTSYAPGDRFEFGLVLIGKAIELLPYFVFVFDRVGRRNGLGSGRGHLSLVEVAWVPVGISSGEAQTVFALPEGRLRDGYSAATVADLFSGQPDACLECSTQVAVRFETPCRLVRGATLTDRPEFHVLFRSLLRRLSSLAYFHCGSDLDLDFRTLAVAAEQVRLIRDETSWFDWERYSARQGVRMNLGGIVGEAEYEGDISPLLPLLRLGEVLHVGKGTGFGLGQYTITSEVGSEGA